MKLLRKIINKVKKIENFRYINALYIIFALFCIIAGFFLSSKPVLEGIRIFSNTTSILFLNICALVLLIVDILIVILDKKNRFIKVKIVCFYIMLLLFCLLVFDLIVLGIGRSFIEALNLGRAPTSADNLGLRLSYYVIKYYKLILQGIFTTLWLSLLGTVIGFVIALVFVYFKTLEINDNDSEFVASLKKCLITFVNIYVTVFRGTPMMVQAIIIYYFLPGILSGIFNVDQNILNQILSVGVAGFITVSLNTTAYLTEVLRGGIEALSKGQMEAARSLGMTRAQAMIHIILPQGIKNSLPAICNEFIINIKDTSVLSVISVMDLFFVIDAINGKNASNDAIFIAAIIYLCLTFGISKLLGLLEKKMNLVSKPLPSSN